MTKDDTTTDTKDDVETPAIPGPFVPSTAPTFVEPEPDAYEPVEEPAEDEESPTANQVGAPGPTPLGSMVVPPVDSAWQDRASGLDQTSLGNLQPDKFNEDE